MKRFNKDDVVEVTNAIWDGEAKGRVIACMQGNLAAVKLYNGTEKIIHFDHLTLIEAAPIYATALMEAIRKDPAAYEGKRYEVVDGDVTHWSERYSTIEVGRDYNTENDMTLLCVDKNGVTTAKLAMITNREQLREIKPAPKPVSFMEAANSGKEIKHEDWSEFYPLGGALENMIASNAYAPKLLNDKKWLIKED